MKSFNYIKKICIPSIAVAAFLQIFTSIAWSADIYVDQVHGNDLSSGLSWSNAMKTVSAGLDLSSTLAGPDTVHVTEGDYYECITLVEDTVLLGGYPAGGGSRNPAVHKSKISGTGSVVTGADSATIDGFIIHNGTGTIITTSPAMVYGGGIKCEGTSPVISNNVIINNNADGDSSLPVFGKGYGGGIYCMDSNATIIDNIIEDNYAQGPDGYNAGAIAYGGGIYCENSTCTISRNVIRNNDVFGGRSSDIHGWGSDAMGAGICCANSSCTISENLIESNFALAGTGDWMSGDSMGAGIYIDSGTSTISRNRILSNLVQVGIFGPPGTALGGGIYADSPDTVIENNLIGFNLADKNGYEDAAGIYTNGRVVHNTFYNNKGHHTVGCGGVRVFDGAEIINNIFSGNEPFAIVVEYGTTPVNIWNNDFHNNVTGILRVDDSTDYTDIVTMETDLAYCQNNISCNPDFAGPGDYRLLPGSCCIDTGSLYRASSIDYYGDPRPFGGGYDIGADEFTGTFVPVNGRTGFFIALTILGLYTELVMRRT